MSIQVVKLADVAEINPRRPALDFADDELVTFVPMESVDGVTGIVVTPFERKFAQVKKGYTVFAEDDVIFAKITPCMQNGKHAIVRNLLKGVGFGSTEFHVIRAGERITPEWIHFFLRRQETLDAAVQTFTGTVGQQRVPSIFFEELELPLPTIDEQRRIAARLKAQLAAVEEARQAAQAQVKEVEALWAAIYRDAFAEIAPVGVPPEFETAPAEWRWERIAPNLARLESGHTPSRLRPDWWGGDVSWVSLTEIRALDGRWTEETQIKTNPAGIANSAARILPRGTVCFSRTASVGFVTIMAKPMATSQDFANWVCGDDLDPEFLMHALIRSRSELRALATGATHKTIYMPTLESFHVCLPERAEQERIVRRLKQLLEVFEQLRIAAKASLEEVERLPARLLAQAFEGQ
ncbi:MAG: hypothetical protein JMDDDDMK_05045 [Acidobacteria bacterium]|nr:hypothetical protein [Acidobacteriota bacterium]